QIARMDQDRMRRYREALDFYQGLQWPGHARPHERRLTMNYAKAIVEKTTSYLMSEVSLTVEPSGTVPSPSSALGARRPEGGHSMGQGEGDGVAAEARARHAEILLQEISDDNSLSQLDFDTE